MSWQGKEKRRYPRADVHCKIFAYARQPRVLGSYTENLSETGVRMILDEKLKVFSTVSIELFLHDDPVMCEGKVIWVTPIESTEFPGLFFYDTGIEFIRKRTA